jgi:hypothetical protein
MGRKCPTPERKHVTAIFIDVTLRAEVDRYRAAESERTGYPLTLQAVIARLLTDGMKRGSTK